MVPPVNVVPAPRQDSLVLMAGALVGMLGGALLMDFVMGVDTVRG